MEHWMLCYFAGCIFLNSLKRIFDKLCTWYPLEMQLIIIDCFWNKRFRKLPVVFTELLRWTYLNVS